MTRSSLHESSDAAAVCAFCSRTRQEVTVMLEGAGAHICDGCTALAHEAMLSRAAVSSSADVQSAATLAREAMHALVAERFVTGAPGAAIEAELRLLVAATLLESGHFDPAQAARFAGLDAAAFAAAHGALGPPPDGAIRPSHPPPG